MGDIFSNAAITVMAAAAKDSNESFPTCSLERMRSQVFHICEAPDQRIRPDVFVREFISTGEEHPDSKPSERPTAPIWSPSKMDSRAWCLQEALLSCRVLRHEPRGMVFRCGKVEHSENRVGFRASDRPFWTDQRPLQQMSTASRRDMIIEWQQVTGAASRRTPTYASDKLPRISGLAAMFSRIFGPNNEHYTVTWKARFVQYLIWTPYHPRPKLEHSEYLSHLWSWPSHRSAV
jgi:hypothetical protein